MRGTAMRKKTVLLAALLLAAVASGAVAPAAAQSNERPADEVGAKRAVAARIVALAFPQEKRMEMFGGMIDAMSSQMAIPPEKIGDAEIRAITDKYLGIMRSDIMADLRANSDGLFEAIAVAYAHGFSLQELRDIERFVATPSGAAYVQRSPKLLVDPAVAEWNTAYFQRIMGIVDARKDAMIEELSALKRTRSGSE